jgi:protein-disulfide isomerase
MMRKATLISVAVAAIVGGYFAGRYYKNRGTDSATVAAGAGAAAAPDGVDRRKVALAGSAKGADQALVNIVEFSDFECPFCGRVNPTLNRLIKENPGKVRLYFRHFPLGMHPNAPLASQAALAAGAQGKFWEMHDKLFENQRALTRPDLEKYAQDLSLDMGKFKQALDSKTFEGEVKKDMTDGEAAGVQGTPAFFVNGRFVSGALPYDNFKKIVDEELETAEKMVKAGVARHAVYAALMAKAGTGAPAAQRPAAPSGPPRPVVSTEVYKVPVGKAPTKGGKQPKVTIVTYSEFECPFCGRVIPSLESLLKTYGDDVSVSFKHFPLPPGMHPNAQLAGEAAVEAQAQGKFWEMHDKMFANQRALTRPDLEKYAQEIGLDMAKFKGALDGGKHKQTVATDQAEGEKFGVRGTPTSFINGRQFRGAQPLESFKIVVDEEIKKADEKLKGGVARGKLYAEIIKDGLDKAAAPPPPPAQAAQPGEPQPGVAYKVDIKGAPTKGAKDALVTIVQFSDFECPFCTRVEPTIDKVLEEYKGKVRVVWKDMPLPFHQNAIPAAVAARAAGEQGKFWEMHAKLFTNNKTLDRPTFERYAQELGLNVAKFKTALDSAKHKEGVQEDMAAGQKVGANGTPAFYINGVSLSGAVPYEQFKAALEPELKKAEALVAKGTKPAKVYETIMKTAKDKVEAPAPGAAPAQPPGPETDMTVHQVDPGDSPSRGPKNAALTVVVFSDFQCPFCSRVEPSISQLEREYPNKVRVVWKNFALDFHQNAKPAANAAHAAGEQGKFWEMHGKLFQNQQSLDRASLDRFAQELNLDMAKFKVAMDSKKYDKVIDEDMKLGATVGVQGTPATFINGRRISGAVPYDTFKKVAEQELSKKGSVAAARKKRGGG